MSKRIWLCVALCGLLAAGLAGVAAANGALAGDEPAMMASPQMVVLGKVDTLTVHTNIAAGLVETGTVELNGVAPLAVWADSRGELAARFAVSDLGLEPGEAVLTLTGLLKSGDEFSVSDTISVK